MDVGDLIAGILGSFIPVSGEKRLERYFRNRPKLAWGMLGLALAGAVAIIFFF
jgi:hypothetical protein